MAKDERQMVCQLSKKTSRHENGDLVLFYKIDIIDVLILLKIINTIQIFYIFVVFSVTLFLRTDILKKAFIDALVLTHRNFATF